MLRPLALVPLLLAAGAAAQASRPVLAVGDVREFVRVVEGGDGELAPVAVEVWTAVEAVEPWSGYDAAVALEREAFGLDGAPLDEPASTVVHVRDDVVRCTVDYEFCRYGLYEQVIRGGDEAVREIDLGGVTVALRSWTDARDRQQGTMNCSTTVRYESMWAEGIGPVEMVETTDRHCNQTDTHERAGLRLTYARSGVEEWGAPVVASTLDPAVAAAEAFFGLEVGSVWEYDLLTDDPASDTASVVRHERWEVVGDSVGTVSGEPRRFFQIHGEVGGLEAQGCWAHVAPEYGYFRLYVESGCDLAGHAQYGYLYGDEGAPSCYGVGGDEVCGPGTDFKRTHSSGTFMNRSEYTFTTRSVAGVGVVETVYRKRWSQGGVMQPDRVEGRRLTYARVGGLEVGAPMPVAAERGPAPLAFSVAPSVTAGRVEARADGPGRLAVFDVRGRRVLEAEVPLGGRLGLDLSGRPAGLYLVRFEAGGRASTARVVVAR